MILIVKVEPNVKLVSKVRGGVRTIGRPKVLFPGGEVLLRLDRASGGVRAAI